MTAASHNATAFGLAAARVAGATLSRKTRTLLTRGDSPRTGQPVWRNSYYEGQIEKRIWRPFADGSVRGGKRLAGALLSAARRIERDTRIERKQSSPGLKRGVLGQIGIDVLEALLDLVDFATGRLEPAIATIAEKTGYCYSAVHEALCRLRAQGFIHWVRRSKPVEDPQPRGQRVEQVTNAYLLLVPRALNGLVEIICGRSGIPGCEEWREIDRKRQVQAMLAALDVREFMRETWRGDPLAGETLKRIASLLEPKWKAKGESGKARETGESVPDP